ncbi:glycosyltransferase [Halobacteria archaeon HArc-gm2]|nr:glycosyltransferase [Halobacteria archaeon HArc-gm2]
MRRTVGHFVGTYLKPTQTFIYQYLKNHDRYDPFVAAARSRHLDRFPFDPRYVLTDLSRMNPRFWLYGALEKFDIYGLERTFYRNVIRQADPDVLHAHFGPMGLRLTEQRAPDRPLVTSFYGYDASQLVQGNDTLRASYLELFEIGDRFLVEGPSMREKLVQLGCPEEKVSLQRIAIDTTRIEPQYPSVDNTFRILMVGRFVEKKGMPDGILAFADAFEDESAELRIVGGQDGGYTEADLRDVAERQGVGQKVTFTGYLDYESYLKEVRNCDLLLAPSKRASTGDSEGGAPTVLLEAQASGKPVVATTHADIPYVVEDGSAGLLVTPGDVESLAGALREFGADPERMAAMGRVGRQNMERRHDIDRLAEQLEQRYDDLVE